MNLPNANERIIFIDISKLLCITLVVIGHYNPAFAPRWYKLLIECIYTFHMPVFLFASGFLYAVTRRNEKYHIFLWRKFKRLMIPYFSSSIIIIALKILTANHAYLESPVSIHTYIEIFYKPAAGYFLWFIWVLWWMFMISPLLKTPASRMVIFLLTLILHFTPISLPEFFCLNALKINAVYFMLGVCAKDFQFALKWIIKRPTWIWTIIFIGVESIIISDTGIWKSIATIVAPYIGVVFVLNLSFKMEHLLVKRWSGLMAIANCSYIIYLFHTTFEGLAKAALIKILGISEMGSFFVPVTITIVLIGLVMPILLQRNVFDKNHLLSFLFGLSPLKTK